MYSTKLLIKHLWLNYSLYQSCFVPIQIKVQIEGKDGKEAHVTFRKILINKCKKEFEKEKSKENLVHAKMDALAQQKLKVCQIDLFAIMMVFIPYYLIPMFSLFSRNKTK